MSNLPAKIERAFEFAGKQLRHLIETYPDYLPMYTVNGKWKHGGEAWTNWCEGFLGGQLWLMHKRTGDGVPGCRRGRPGRAAPPAARHAPRVPEAREDG